MTVRTKSVVLLIGTLLLGMLLGALLHARLTDDRIARIASLRSQRGFVRYMERAIEPESEAQRQEVRAILEEAAGQMQNRFTRHRTEMHALMDSTRARLAAVLSEEQLQKLDARLERRRGPRGPGRGPRAHPE